MNLFRSEDSVRGWSDFDPTTEKAIKPVREWAALLTGGTVFQQRMDDDFVANSESYANDALTALAAELS